MHRSLIGLFVSFVVTSPVLAVDYANINRTINKEPVYQSKAPKYALLLFGHEAPLRVWVILDGDVVYLDRNGDGNLTDKAKRFANLSDCRNIEISGPNQQPHYVITSLNVYSDGDPQKSRLMVNVDIKTPVSFRQYSDLELQSSPAKAALSHFDGPLSAGPKTISWKLPPGFALKTGAKPTDLFALMGTMDASHGCWVVVRSHNRDKSAFADGVCPVVDIEFPAKTPGGAFVKQRYQLDKFC